MQLRNARLCLDCDEVHDAEHCPACASESFAFITRWVPAPSVDPAQTGPSARPRQDGREARPHSPPAEPASETLASYRQMLDRRPPTQWRYVKRSALGLALFGLAGWAWKQQGQRSAQAPGNQPRDDPQD